MTRDEIIKVSKEGAKSAADPQGGRPVSAKHLARSAELKRKARGTSEKYEARKR